MSVDLAQLALSVDANGFIKADRTLTSFNKTASNTEKQADKIARSTDAMTKSMMAADKVIGIIAGGIGVLFGGLAVDKVLDYADAWTNVSNTLRGVTNSQEELIKTQNKVIALAKDTSSSLEATAGLYAAITRSVADLKISQDRVLGVTKTINNLFLAGGKSATEAAGAIIQLNQGLAAGALRGDEFNSVAEGAPRILDAVAKQLKMTRGELRDFAATGGITAEILISSLESYSDEAQHAADITKRTFSQNKELAKTMALEWVGTSEAVSNFSSVAGQALVSVAKNIDKAIDIATVLAVVFSARLAGSIAAKTAATIADIAATNAQMAAENNAALGAQRRAVADQEAALAVLNRSRAESSFAVAAVASARQVDAARIESLRSVAAQIEAERVLENQRLQAQISARGIELSLQRMSALGIEHANVLNQITLAEANLVRGSEGVAAAQSSQAAAQARLTVATEAYAEATLAANAANARLAASSATASAAARGLSGALALVGGPAGLAFIAGAALIYLGMQSTDAEKRLDKLRAAAEGSGTAIQNLGEAGKKNRMNVVSDEIAAATDQMTRLQNLLKQTEGGGFSSKSIDRVRADIELLQNEIKDLNTEMASLSGASEELSQSFDTLSAKQLSTALYQLGQDLDANYQKYAESSKSIADMNKQFAKEIDLVGNTSKETEILYDLNHKNIIANDEQTASLLANAKALDKANVNLQDRIDLMQSMSDIIADVENSMPNFEAALQEAFKGPAESGGNIVERTFGKAQDINDLAKEVDGLGGSWSRTGSIIADSFGGVADAMNDYIQRIKEIEEKQRSADVSIAKTNAEEIELEKIKIKLADEHAAATISGYGKMAGAAASMFKEQSKGRKALNNAEKVFTAVEIALAAKKASANALTAITSAFSAPFPVNFAAGAAMIAIMAGLGVFGGGGGSKGPSSADIQKSQGTGTVLGDSSAKSESIKKSFDDFKNIAVDQLSELRGIHNAMTSLSSGIAGLAQSIVVNGNIGGKGVSGLGKTDSNEKIDSIIGATAKTGSIAASIITVTNKIFGGAIDKFQSQIFGSTTKKLKDTGLILGAQDLGDIIAGDINALYYNTVETTKKKLFGLSKSTKTKDILTGADSGLTDQISNIFEFLSVTISESLKVLGIDAQNSIDGFVVDIGKISFKDLKGEEIQKQLEAVFSAQGDLLAKYVLPQITEYQKLGEGAFETLTRVAKEQAVFNDAIDKMGLSLGGLSNMMRIDVAQSIITLMGGLDEFTSKTSAYVDKFFSDSEKTSMLGKSLDDVFGSLGISMPATDNGFRDIVESLDLTTESGQELFTSLMQIAPSFDQYTTALDKLYQAQLSSAKTLAGQSLDALKASISAEKALSQSRLDSAKIALSTAQAERDAAASRYDAAENALSASFNAEIASIEKLRDERLSALDSELTAAKDTQKANQDAVSSAQKALEDALSAEQNMREDSLNAQISGYRKVADEAQAYAQSLRSLSENLRSSIAGMGPNTIENAIARRAATQAQIDQALASARGGNFTKAMGLDLSGLQNTDGMFATKAQRDFNVGVTQNKLAEIASLADGQATVQDKSYAAAERSATALEHQVQQLSTVNNSVLSVADATKQLADAQAKASASDAIVANLEAQVAQAKTTTDQQIAALQAQLDALVGNKDAVLSVDDAIKQFLDAKEGLAIADAQLETAKSALAVAQTMYDAENAAYDEIIAQQTALYNSALGIDDSVKSVGDAVDQLSMALANYTAINQQQQQQIAAISNQQSINDAQSLANESAMKDEIASLRAENKELQQKMADSLKTIADNSTKSLNRELLA